MTGDLARFAFALIALAVGASAEELLPKPLGVGFPLLLVMSQALSTRRSLMPAVLFALAAGSFEDAISGLPAMTSVSYFLAVALIARWLGASLGLVVITYPCYHLWLSLWMTTVGGSVYSRILLAIPFGLVTACFMGIVLAWIDRKAATDEC